MDSFEERRRAAEARFAFDQDVAFKTQARANKALGLWVAHQLDLSPEEAAAYAIEIVRSDFEEPGFGDVLRKIKADLGYAFDEFVVRKKAAELYEAELQRMKNG
ncbi:MAG: ATPase inhibitor subunit zeta [Rhodobacteraceae bacterium]|nr:ATPase inhibitor subunit zeta [Paracoccaceae bacterium]